MADGENEIERKIIQLAREWMDAIGRRDSVSLDRILANDFLISGLLPQGQLADKKLYIEDCMRPMMSRKRLSFQPMESPRLRQYSGCELRL